MADIGREPPKSDPEMTLEGIKLLVIWAAVIALTVVLFQQLM